MTDERNRREREQILARRRFFVASALAGVVSACNHSGAQPCLQVVAPAPDGGAQPDPPVEEDAGVTEAPPDASPEDPPPHACLRVVEPPPHVCLEFAEPPGRKE